MASGDKTTRNKLDYSYSVVIPLYKSELTIRNVVEEVVEEFDRLGIDRYEIILVNDGSPDGVMSVAIGLVEENPHVTAIDLAKNMGQSSAVFAGLERAKGDYIITMDDDMQHPGYEIGTLIDAIIDRDDDVVFAAFDESENKRSLFRRMGTRFHWWTLEHFAGKPKEIQSNSFRIMKRFIRDVYVQIEGQYTSSFGVICGCTSHISNVRVKHRPRAVGKSGFKLSALFSGLITSILANSSVPLRVAAVVGVILFFVSVIGMLVGLIIHRFYIGLFWGFGLLCSFQLIALGVLGEYTNRIFNATRRTPRFAIRGIYTNDGSGEADNETAL